MPRNQSLALACCAFLVWIASQASAELSRSCGSSSPFVFTRPDQLFRTDYGELKAVTLEEENLLQKRRLAVGMLTMEPLSLFLPHYINGPAVVYVHRGQARISHLRRSVGIVKSVELSGSEIYSISGGTMFYIENAEANETLEILILVDLSELPKEVAVQSFYLAGGTYPTSILSGFTNELLGSAFKVSAEEVRNFLWLQRQGPIINASDMIELRKKSACVSDEDSARERTEDAPVVEESKEEGEDEQAEESKKGELEEENKKKKGDKKHKGKKEKHYLLLDEKHIFRNQNGWMATLDEKNAKILKSLDVGVLAIGLKSGSMVAPHWNPDMSMVGIVTHGRGSIQIIRSDGFIAVNKELEPGFVFVVPRYHPSAQLATLDSDFEFIGFTTSSQPMNPEFLAGTNSIFNAMDSDSLSKVFDADPDEDILADLRGAQPDAIILTTPNSGW